MSQRQSQLWSRFERQIRNDPIVQEEKIQAGEVTVVANQALLRGIVEEVAEHYVDQVDLDLTTPIHIRHTETVVFRKGLAFRGLLHARIEIHRIQGRLRAGKPEVSLQAPDRINFKLPLQAEQASGDATFGLRWDPEGLANVACRAFSASERLQATLVPRQYIFEGQLLLSVDPTGFVAHPVFPDVAYPLRFDLTPQSWKKVDALVSRQTDVQRCAALKFVRNDLVNRKLRALFKGKGLRIRMPKAVFRDFLLPARLRTELRVAERPIALEVKPNQVRMSRGALWLSAQVRVKPRPPVDPAR